MTYPLSSGHIDYSSPPITNDGRQILEVLLDLEQPFAPKLASRQLPRGSMIPGPLEDLATFFSREELAENMIICFEGN